MCPLSERSCAIDESMLRSERIHLSSSSRRIVPSGPIDCRRWPLSDMGWCPLRLMGCDGSKRCCKCAGGCCA